MGSLPSDSQVKQHRFFKIIFSDSVSDSKLKIPRAFVRKYGKNLADHVSLKAQSGAVWQVELERSDGGEVWLKDGWPEFATYYSLCFGHFLVLEYEGNSHFNLIIFDKSACEIEYPISEESNLNGDKFSEPCINHSEKTRANSTFEEANRSGRCNQKVRARRVCGLGLITEADNTRALASAKAFKSKSPFVVAIMFPSYITGHSMSIPKTFVETFITKECDRVILKVKGRTWRTKCTLYSTNAKLSCGWNAFARDNFLSAGDVCVFELIDCTKNLVNVVIFQAVNSTFEEANHRGGRMQENAHNSSNKRIRTNHVDELENISNQKAKISPFHSTGHNRMNPIKLEDDLDSYGSVQEVRARGVCGLGLVTEADKTRALASAKAFKSKNPFIIVIMRPSHVTWKFTMSLPKTFVETYIAEVSDKVILQVTGRTWPAKCTLYQNKSLLTCGWTAFARDNYLSVGDVCVFELIDRTKNLLNVVIFRAAKDGNC